MEGDRHLHFNILQAMWFFIFFIVLINFMKFVFNRWYIKGVSELVNNA